LPLPQKKVQGGIFFFFGVCPQVFDAVLSVLSRTNFLKFIFNDKEIVSIATKDEQPIFFFLYFLSRYKYLMYLDDVNFQSQKLAPTSVEVTARSPANKRGFFLSSKSVSSASD